MAKLYIIGNGFDLAHDLPTSYSDFYKWLNGTHYEMDNNNNYSEFISQMDEIFAHANNGAPIDLWSDFENALGNLKIGEFVKEVAEEYDTKDQEDEHHGNPGALAEQVSSYIEYIAKPWALDEIRKKFTEWVQKIPIYDDTEPCFTEEDIETDGIYLTFNYTNTLEKVYHISPEQVFHIHGLASDPSSEIIVGHETKYKTSDYSDVEEELFGIDADIFPTMVGTMNGLRKNTKHIIAENQNWFDELSKRNIQEIHLYGLSFGAIDDDYFREIHQRLPNAHWRFAVYARTNYDETSNKKRIQEFVKRIGINKNNCSAYDQDDINERVIVL